MKKNTLSAILMTLFLFISCNNSGKDGNTSANSADESVKGPNLTEISKKITESNAVVLAVKEVETLLSSIDELAKAIGKKIQNNGLVNEANQNGSLLAGAHAISALITQKLNKFKDSEGLKEKIEMAKDCAGAFTKKLQEKNAELGISGATDAHAKEAILKTNNTKDKGVDELVKLSEAVGNLSKAANELLNNSVKELISPVVAENPKKP